jgi:sugar/nucleoside kinase (ribokinase family)
MPSTASGRLLDVLTVADMCVDLILTGDVRPRFNQIEQLIENYELELGGSANIFASQLAKLGARVGVIGRVGQDALGDFVLQKLQAIGVETSRLSRHPQLKTGLGVALAEPQDRAILTYLGTIDAVQPRDLSEEVSTVARHWHIASYFLLRSLRGHWRDWVRRCKGAGMTVSLDVNWDPENLWEGVTDLLPFVDVFFPNQNEAMRIAGESEVVRAAQRLASYGPLVVTKCGREGAMALKGKRKWEIHPSEVDVGPGAVIDSIGAGDNFDAGFVRAWLLNRSVDECLLLGHRCAVASLASAGGIQGQLQEHIT